MLIDFNSTLNFISEADDIGRISITKDDFGKETKFSTIPKGILIQDSYNNPFLPIKPRPKIDTYEADIVEIYKRYRELYYQFEVVLLPWHFVIEMIGDRYVSFNTRPLDMKYPLTNQEVKPQEPLWNQDTQDFMYRNLYDISEMIHILVIGDSNTDVYTLKFYQILSRFCILPFLKYFRIPITEGQSIFKLNMGSKFNFSLATKFLK